MSACASGTTVGGVDVSDYDTGTVWTSVAGAGNKKFAYIKATEGLTFTNTKFASDWAEAKSAGVSRGAYHFFHPADDATQQADFFVATMGTLAAGDLPPLLDWEDTDSVSSAADIAAAQTFLDRVETLTGKVPVIYVDPSFFNALGNPVQFIKYRLFIANYGVTCPQIPPPWSEWTFWQSSDTGSVTGIQGGADLDNFNGTAAQLLQFGLSGTF